MYKKVSDGIYKILANSNIYIIMPEIVGNENPIIIDAGDRQYHNSVISDINELIDPMTVKEVYLTHLHYDHVGNIDIFKNATFYASKDAIDSYKKDSFGTIFSDDFFKKFDIELNEFLKKEKLPFEIFKTPGHTVGSVCFFLKDKKILFSGDTLFFNHAIGRTDLPNSVPEKMQESLKKIMELDFELLCPGHDY